MRHGWRWWVGGGGWLLTLLSSGALAGTQQPQFGWPVACAAGESCWIVNYVDHDEGEGVRDYACGTATYNAPPNNRHQGTDIAVRDLAVMRSGIAVLAAADGIVRGVRDGMADVSVRDAAAPEIGGRECGNGVRIDHGDGWTSQYCHLRQGSISVRPGTPVKAGDQLGMVGLSGATEYPHLHFQIERNRGIVDPFVGLDRQAPCGPGEQPLWRADILAGLGPYQPTALDLAGFSSGTPDIAAARDGRGGADVIGRNAPALVLWVDIFNVRAGDVVEMRILDPTGATIFVHRDAVPKNQARRFVYAGTKRQGEGWAPGLYAGEIRLVRESFEARPPVPPATASVRID